MLARACLVSVFLTAIFALFITSLWDIFYLSSGILTTAVALPVASVFIKHVKATPLLWSSVAGFAGTIVFYFLEKAPFFRNIEPEFLLNSGVGFIFFGIASAIFGYFSGLALEKEQVHN